MKTQLLPSTYPPFYFNPLYPTPSPLHLFPLPIHSLFLSSHLFHLPYPSFRLILPSISNYFPPLSSSLPPSPPFQLPCAPLPPSFPKLPIPSVFLFSHLSHHLYAFFYINREGREKGRGDIEGGRKGWGESNAIRESDYRIGVFRGKGRDRREGGRGRGRGEEGK